MKLKLKLKLAKFFGYNMIVNEKSKEVHNLNTPHVNCHVNEIRRYKLIRSKDLLKYIGKGYNGCRWCMSKYDDDIRYNRNVYKFMAEVQEEETAKKKKK